MRGRRLGAIAAGIVVLAALGVGAALVLRHAPDPDALPPRMSGRTVALAAQIQQARPPYRVVIGDSHAERLFLPSLCGDPVIDAGFSGARTSEVARAAARLAFAQPAEAIVVILGTNDLLRRRRPAAPETMEAFRREYRRLLDGLRSHAGRLLAAPIPALDGERSEVARAFAVDLAPAYDAIIAQECARVGCVTAPLFPDEPRDRAASLDGVHPSIDALTRSDGVRDRLERAACAR